ncbi:hypothetical protein SERLADRAFT_406185 [Serpula lacrymans var. lacrymans S7.9]|uniref:Uncharacterized protein Slrcb1 n=1 Tax=Serpula lacrymans var. lacrymans (strain S7.9) TaxID=578457 RepID=F8NKI7_SERL9|nr:uncharacterized protein SERLADRAFT_406185 [Serpula lacrymans var. lacrymans S7.9]EGO28761.1 hypothetical protein SERLADRAFT_406185 [Serpula lacrymans var. lacrymans S7.9]
MAYIVNPTYPLFPIFAFFGFILVLIPLPWHLQAWNAGTCVYMIWAAVACLIEFVNSVVWNGSALNVAPVWCDISSKILLGAGVGIPAASLCISRRLYKIAVIKTVSTTRQDKVRALVIDLCISIGIPVLVMILHYVVQGHRFDILENVGCYPTIYNTLPAYFLVFMWPSLLGCVSFVFSGLTLHAFYKRRLEFSQFVNSNTSLSINRYIRLMLLAAIEMAFTIPISIYSIYISNKGVTLEPWISWSNVHYGFSYVGLIPAVEWASDPGYKTSVEMTRWLFPSCALLFFAIFGFAGEARKNYCLAFWSVAKLFGWSPRKPQLSVPASTRWNAAFKSNSGVSVGSLPAYTLPTPPRPKYNMDDDIEKSAGLPSARLPEYSKGDGQSPTDSKYPLSVPPQHVDVRYYLLFAIASPLSIGRTKTSHPASIPSAIYTAQRVSYCITISHSALSNS